MKAMRKRLADERGEGVISVAIAVLIMAFIGAGMWVVFSGAMTNAGEKISDNVECIGSNTSCTNPLPAATGT